MKFHELLLDRKILTRYYDGDGLRDGVRMTIGNREEMERYGGAQDLLEEWN